MSKSKKDKLAEYNSKRDFRKTAEPRGGKASGGDEPIFVVQKHDASRLHYDVRLEIDGTLASWAVPKGPSTDTKTKRLAVRTEDHPMEYADFEGVIPEGEYGGGTIMVWDYGTVTFKNEGKSPAEWLEEGILEFELHGRKLRGWWVLIHSKMGGQEKNWLLSKMKGDDHAASDILSDKPHSAKTGRSLEQIAEEKRG